MTRIPEIVDAMTRVPAQMPGRTGTNQAKGNDAMTRDEARRMAEILQAYADGAEVQQYVKTEKLWVDIEDPHFRGPSDRYRIKPAEPDSIDWSHVAPGYNWMARDENGEAFAYSNRPQQAGDAWVEGEGGRYERVDRVLASYHRGTVDWADSLMERPK